ncbi:ATP-binding protein, partial [Pseudoalteromonas sp. SG43-7]|nr:ATP-binding protein [Pseudoalteromonas sp. SR45-6]MBB1424830.1 ATP-binding protein [Pseudoalteromonas sp. SG43-7]
EPLSAQQRGDLLELIDARYGYKSHIIISQLPQENWHEMIGESIRKQLNKLTDDDQLS